SDATNNTVFQDQLDEVRDALLRGAGLSQPMEDTGMFPLPALQMIRVGERTGTLGIQLGKAAAYYEREVSFRLKKATELFQPVIIFGVGLLVGFVAVAQIAAMYSVFSQVK
ncbi:MAG: type pilus assembly protein PilC, partial [Actinomycetota bacterium]